MTPKRWRTVINLTIAGSGAVVLALLGTIEPGACMVIVGVSLWGIGRALGG